MHLKKKDVKAKIDDFLLAQSLNRSPGVNGREFPIEWL